MNPAALKANLRDVPPGGAIVVNEDAFNPQNLAKAGYDANPLEDGSLKDFNVFEIPIGTLNARALEGLDMSTKQVDMTKNFFALGVMFWLYERSMDPTIRWIESKFEGRPVIAEANLRALKAGYAFGETTEDLPHPLPRPARQPATRHLSQHHRQRGRGAGLRGRQQAGRPRALLRLLSHHPGQRHPPPALHLQALRGAHLPGRGRDRRHRLGHRRLLRRGPRADRLVRSRHRAEERGHGPRGDGRAAARGRRRAARRPIHRHAHEDRAGRSAAGDVRPQRRGADARGRSGHARRVLRLRHRGVAPGTEVHDTRRLPLGRLPGHGLGALAHPGARGPARHLGGEPHRRRVLPSLPARPRDPRATLGRAGHARASSTASVASRRRMSAARSRTTRTTTSA